VGKKPTKVHNTVSHVLRHFHGDHRCAIGKQAVLGGDGTNDFNISAREGRERQADRFVSLCTDDRAFTGRGTIRVASMRHKSTRAHEMFADDNNGRTVAKTLSQPGRGGRMNTGRKSLLSHDIVDR
jgi:hypothetical protein